MSINIKICRKLLPSPITPVCCRWSRVVVSWRNHARWPHCDDDLRDNNHSVNLENSRSVTLTGLTFACFANFALFRESLSREKSKIANSRKFISRNSANIFIARLNLVKIVFILPKKPKKFLKISLFANVYLSKFFDCSNSRKFIHAKVNPIKVNTMATIIFWSDFQSSFPGLFRAFWYS